MRVLVVSNWFPPHHKGGYEANCEDVSNRLFWRGHEIEVLCSDTRMAGVADGEHPYPVRRVLKAFWKDATPWTPPPFELLQAERHNQRTLLERIDSFHPDVVFVWHMAAMSLNLLTLLAQRRQRVVLAICDSWPTYALAQDPWSRTWNCNPFSRVIGRIIQRATGIATVLPDIGEIGTACFVSVFTQRDVMTNAPWTFSDHRVIPSGIDRAALAGPSKASTDDWKWRIAYIGRLDPRKGVGTLIDALGLLPEDATLHIYGRAEAGEREWLEAIASRRGVQERLEFSMRSKGNMGDAYRTSDCVVFPTEWAEPFGLVPLEAMECGTPVVATGTGGSGEFLTHDENCLLFEPGNADQLAEAITSLAKDPGLRTRLIQSGQCTASEYDVEYMADSYERELQGETLFGARTEDDLDGSPADPISRHRRAADKLLWENNRGVGNPSHIKGLYQDLGDWWWEHHQTGDQAIPVLSYPETAPLVAAQLNAVAGLVLDAGCGPNPATSIRVATQPGTDLVILDVGLGTVRVACESAQSSGARVLGVVGDVEQLPFRSASFAGVICDDTIEHLPDDLAGIRELARVAKTSAPVVLATPNRHSAVVLKARFADRWRGVRRPSHHYYSSNSHLREYTWTDFERLARSSLKVTRRVPVGWSEGRRRKILSRLLFGPGRFISQAIVLVCRSSQ